MRKPFFGNCENKDTDQVRSNCAADQRLSFRYTDSTIFLLQDLFHVYLNKCEFQFLRLHINKTNTFCFLIDNGRVTGTTK